MQAYKEIPIDYQEIQSQAKIINFSKGTEFSLRKSVNLPNTDRTRGFTLSLRKYLIYL